MFKEIVVGLDGSPRQPMVLRTAVRVAEAFEARLHLCRAMAVPLSVPAIAWSLRGDDFENFLLEHGNEAMGRLSDEIPPKVRRTTHCKVGQPADVLCTVAKDVGASLIILGSHGFEGIDRVLGTTASKVANRAPCSVLVARQETD